MTNKATSKKNSKKHYGTLGISRNTVSTWMKSKNKLLQRSEQTSSNTKKLRGYEQVNKAILKWFSLQRIQNIPIDGTMIKEKALLFAEKFNFTNFKASDGRMDKWKKR